MTREEEIIDAARVRADRHEIAEKELHNYSSQLYFYDRIYNAEIASFEAGVKWSDEHQNNVWHDANIVIPPQDEEVIVLIDDIHCGSNYKIAFGHIVDKTRCVDYNGWNIPDVVCWMPCPQIPYEKEE